MRLRSGWLLAALCLGAAFPLLWYAAWEGSRGNDLDTYQHQLLELRQRLLYAEKENSKRSHELSSVLGEIKHIVAKRINLTTNHTDGMKVLNVTGKLPMHLTNLYYYLPHLREYEDAIIPNIVIGQQRTGVSLVMGIPTVKREKQSYLMSTLQSLLYGLSEKQKNDCVIIIFVAELPQRGPVWSPRDYFSSCFLLSRSFQSEENIWGFRGQSKLEDDIIAKPDYIQSIENFAAEQSQEWMVLEFSQLGFIGKLFKTEDLPLIVEFFVMFYKDKPIDWLLDHLFWVKVCNPEKNAAHCEKEKARLRIRAKPSLFQHMGLHSSLSGKIQNLKDKDFGRSVLHKAHNNPPAKLHTSLRIYQQYTLENVYEGKGYFWATAPMAGDYISFTFLKPLKVEKYYFRSGNMDYPGDILYDTTVEVLPADEAVRKGLVNYTATKDGYLKIGAFENGIAEGSIDLSVGEILAIRLLVNSDSPVWAILSEVLIKMSEN
eukprot:XP_025006285.1 alpha-1,3-mannosyl-glycoprotein 4-beta-N-acetylglucosaminyltransferase-like protein MGAT4D isoform X2 [Gallus gallus]